MGCSLANIKGLVDGSHTGPIGILCHRQDHGRARDSLRLTRHNGCVNTGPDSQATPYDEFGGEAFFEPLVAGFYARVADDDLLRPMYPDVDLGPAERRLRMFLIQYWGGPKTYGDERGHPRLRMRHAPFPVTPAAKDRWLLLMGQSLDDVATRQILDPAMREKLWQYLTMAADSMLNTTE